MNKNLRIFIISNLYPPHYIGGYELGCQDCVNELIRRGHEVLVLTSNYRKSDCDDNRSDAIRELKIDFSYHPLGFLELLNQTKNDFVILDTAYHTFKPNIVIIFNTWGIQKRLLSRADEYSTQVLYAISDYSLVDRLFKDPWIDFWYRRAHTIQRRWIKSILRKIMKPFGFGIPPINVKSMIRNAFFTSEALRKTYIDAGFLPTISRVIHWGISNEHFQNLSLKSSSPKRLLFVGNLRYDKGTHTAIEAFGLLKKRGYSDLILDIIGGSQMPEYVQSLKKRITELSLNESIRFIPALPRSNMPAIYEDHDILIFPSIWEEPFSITILEAMASGLSVVSTPTGGSIEILRDGENSLVFEPGNQEHLADKVQILLNHEDIYHRIRLNGQEIVRSNYTLENTVDSIENLLYEIIEAKRQTPLNQFA